MSTTGTLGGTFTLGSRTIHRMGFGAMQLAGPHVFGPPTDPVEAANVLRTAIEAGVDHIDTSDFYGPHVTNQLIRETLHPYRDNLTLVTKIGARRTADAGWIPAQATPLLRAAVEDNLKNLGLDVLEVVNLRIFSDPMKPPVYSNISRQLDVMFELQREDKIKHIGLSNVVQQHVEDGLKLGPIVCVQNAYGVLNRHDDDLLEFCADRDIAFVPFFPLGGTMTPLKSQVVEEVAAELKVTPHQTALAWLLHCPANVLLIPGTSKVAHLKENLAAAEIVLNEDQLKRLDA